MADFTVPNYSDLIDNLNPQIAGGPPKVDFSGLERIPQSYYAGQKNQYDQRLRNIFSGGVPQNADGSVDYGAMSKSLLQAGGAQEVPNAISLGNTQLGRDVLGSTGVLPPSASNVQPTGQQPGQQAGGPANAIAGIESGGNYSAVGPITKDGDRALGKYQVLTKNIAPWTKEVLGQEMSPRDFLQNPQAQDAVFNAKFGQYSQKYGPEGAARAWFAGEGGMNNPNASDGYMNVAQYGNRFTQAGGANGAPAAPVQQNPQTQPPYAQQSPTPTQNVPAQPTETLANAYESRANYFYQQAKGLAFANPKAADAAKAQGDQAAQQAIEIRKSLLKSAQPTPDMQNAQASGVASPLALDQQKEVQKTNINAGQKQYEGIQAQSTQYERDLKPYLDISKSILNDPKMYSGIGGQFALDFNRVRAALGDKDAAVLQEALQKVTAASVLSQINNQRAQVQEAGGASTRIFRQQVDLVEKAAPALANTPAGNRFLVEVSSRMGDLSSRVADLAREYKNKNGYLDSGFDARLSDYMKSNPVFTKQELTHPETLGAPTVPPQYASNPQAFSQWASSMGLKKGDAVRLPSGRVKALDASVVGQ